MSRIFKNANFTTRNHECTNVVLAVGDKAPKGNWIEIAESEGDKYNDLTRLYVEKGISYYGYL